MRGSQVQVGRLADLSVALDDAWDAKSACQAAAAWLAEDDALMPSIYLHRGGRLRCQAVARYWQVFDGMLPGVGVIGQTYVTGEPAFLAATDESGQYLEVAPGVRGEACAPVRSAGQVIGAVNVESKGALEPAVADTLAACAELLGRRIDAMGGLPRESRSQRLARHASRIAALSDAGEIRLEVLKAACDVADMESAMLVNPAGAEPEIDAWGPHAERLRGLAPEAMAKISGWTESMSSVYSVGEPDGAGFDGHADLRAAGVEAFVALPVPKPTGPGSVLLLMHGQPTRLPTEDVELLELLAAQTASALHTAAGIAELHDRAARDPLTDLAHKSTFRKALQGACDEQVPMSLLIVDVDCFKDVNDSKGHAAGDELLVHCAAVLEDGLRAGDRLFRIGGDEFAVMADGAAEAEGAALAERLRAAVATLGGPTVSVGVATRRSAESHDELFARADRALYAAKHEGRNTVVAH